MKRDPHKPSEGQTLKAVCDWLDAKGFLWIRVQVNRPFNDRKTGQVRFAPVRKSQLGSPDIILFGHERSEQLVYALEIKSYNGRLRAEQIQWSERAVKIGIKCYVIRNVDELEKILV
jgi:hypothetical protein